MILLMMVLGMSALVSSGSAAVPIKPGKFQQGYIPQTTDWGIMEMGVNLLNAGNYLVFQAVFDKPITSPQTDKPTDGGSVSLFEAGSKLIAVFYYLSFFVAVIMGFIAIYMAFGRNQFQTALMWLGGAIVLPFIVYIVEMIFSIAS